MLLIVALGTVYFLSVMRRYTQVLLSPVILTLYSFANSALLILNSFTIMEDFGLVRFGTS